MLPSSVPVDNTSFIFPLRLALLSLYVQISSGTSKPSHPCKYNANVLQVLFQLKLSVWASNMIWIKFNSILYRGWGGNDPPLIKKLSCMFFLPSSVPVGNSSFKSDHDPKNENIQNMKTSPKK